MRRGWKKNKKNLLLELSLRELKSTLICLLQCIQGQIIFLSLPINGRSRRSIQINWSITDFHIFVGWRLKLPLSSMTFVTGKNPQIWNSLKAGQKSWRIKNFNLSSSATISESNIFNQVWQKVETLSIGLLWLNISARFYGFMYLCKLRHSMTRVVELHGSSKSA